MKYCEHCGKELASEVQICTACGCYANSNSTVTFKRKSQYVGCLVPMHIEIIGKNTKTTLDINNGKTVSADLPCGNYRFHIYGSLSDKCHDVKISKDTTYNLSWHSFTGSIIFKEV